MRLDDHTLTKEEQRELLRDVLPACQPQEGTPQNTFTRTFQFCLLSLHLFASSCLLTPSCASFLTNKESELDDLRKALPSIEVGEADKKEAISNTIDICNFTQWEAQGPQSGEAEELMPSLPQEDTLDWHGAPRFHKEVSLPRDFRAKVRSGEFTGPTNGVCPGFLQCNLVVLPQGPVAFDFLLFCQRNPKACPLIDVCDVGSPFASGVAPGADLRTDVPK